MNTQVHVLSLAVLLAILHPGHVTSQPVTSKPKVIKLCSSHLTDTLLLICEGRGLSGPQQSASSSSSHEDPYLQREEANSLLSSKGVANVCCTQGCSRRDLESYCATPRDEGVTPRKIAAFDDTTVAQTSTTPNDQSNHIQGEVSEGNEQSDDRYEVGTIPPEFFGTPVIMSRGRVYRSPIDI